MKEKKRQQATRFSLRLCERSCLKPIQRLQIEQVKEFAKERIRRMPDDAKPKSSAANDGADLAEMFKKLLLSNESNIGIAGFEKIISDFDGESIPIKTWIENFELNAEAYGLSEKQKYVHARNKMSGIAKLFLDAVTVNDFNKLKAELFKEFHTELNSAEVHDLMRNRRKKTNETFHEYVLEMCKLAKLGDIEEAAIIKRVVAGLRIDNEAKYLLYSSKTLRQLRENYEIVETIEGEPKQSSRSQVRQNLDQARSRKPLHCYNCGSTEHKRSECTTSTKCFRCNQHGHVAKNCVNATKHVNTITERKRIKDIMLDGVNIQCLVDTGADVSITKHSVFKKVGGETLMKSSSVLNGLGNTKTHPIGEFTGKIEVDNISVYQKFVVVPDNVIQHDALLGYDFLRRLSFSCDDNGFKFVTLIPVEDHPKVEKISIYNIIDTDTNIVVPPQHYQQVREMVEKYDPKPLIKCPIELKIVPDGEMRNFRHAPSRLPPEEDEIVRRQVEDWLKDGIVRKSCSSVASRIVVVKKKCGARRVCIDFRQLNKMVLKDCFPVPMMDDIFVKLQGARFFATMDLENGFFHVPINEESRKYTAFVTKQGLFEFNVVPFGFCNSPAVFIRFINHIFQDLINKNVLELYMDDIIVFATTAEECLEKVEKVLRQAGKYGLKIKWQKCSFLQKKINFLGHIIENGEIRPGDEKINAVRKFKTPKNVTQVQAFLGLTGFFRRFIERYSHIARPLTNLLKKESTFRMGPEELEALENLKLRLTTEPVLRIYCRGAPTELCTDASKEGFGAILQQAFEGKMHPVFYWSKKASPQEGQKHSYILEVKAAFLAMEKFRNYLLGIRFKLVTDCAAFKQTINKKDIPREVAQWILYLQDYNFEVEHRPGEKIRHTDFLSRHPQNVLLVSTEIVARIEKAQKNDDHIKAVAEILKSRPYEGYKFKGSLMFKNIDGNDVLVVPKSMEKEIIQETHSVGHYSTQKTTHIIRQQYAIPHVEKKVNQVIANCVRCIIQNKKLGKKEGFLHCINKGDVPLHTIHIDHLGPMDATSKMYKFIFAMVDGFTKFVWLYPTKSTGCEEVLKKLSEWSNIFGKPVRLISDQGTAFTANAFKSYVDENRIEHILTTTGVARGNGQIERVNRSILAIIAKLSSDDPSKWYKLVANVQIAINLHTNCSTKVSPFHLMFGVKMNHKPDDRILQMLEEEIIINFDEDRNRLREEAKQQIQQAQIAYKRNYDRNRKPESVYKIGDLVAIKRTQFVPGRKLAGCYFGPYEIIKVKRNGRYDVKKAAECEGPKTTSTSNDHMKLWRYVQENDDLLSSGTDDDM